MLEEEKKVGSKGQVVIPKVIRKILKIYPGSRIVFKLEDGRLILENPVFDAVDALEKIAKKGPSISEISPHIYEEELRTRNL